MASEPAFSYYYQREVKIAGVGYDLYHVTDYDGRPTLPITMPVEFDIQPLQEALPKAPFGNIVEFVESERRLGPALAAAKLPDAFNGMYGHVSRGAMYGVLKSLALQGQAYYNDDFPDLPALLDAWQDTPAFNMPEKVDKTACKFSGLWHAPLGYIGEAMATRDLSVLSKVRPGWLRATLHPLIRYPHMDGAQAMAGMTEHVDVDLGEALVMSGIVQEYQHDFVHPMRKIFDTTRIDLSPLLVPGPLPHNIKRILAKPILGYLDDRRQCAWQRSLELDAAGPGSEEYQRLVKEYSAESCRRIDTILSLGIVAARLTSLSESAGQLFGRPQQTAI